MAHRGGQPIADCAFFMVLPSEVRVSILTAAFGGMTVHIQRCHPAKLLPQARSTSSGSAKRWLEAVLTRKTKEKSGGTRSAGREKQWWVCVCCRLPDDSPAADTCLADLMRSRSEGRWLCVSPPEAPPDLAVGAIGWLLSCRKAYNEGMKVLYSGNTFHVRTVNLCTFGGLVPQIPATGLSYITSVEFVLDRLFVSQNDFVALPKANALEADILEETLSSMPRLMPSLRKLYLGFCPDTCLVDECEGGAALKYECTKHLMKLMAAVARDLGRVERSCDIELGLPSTVFDRYRDEAIMKRCRMGVPGWNPGMSNEFSYHPRLRVFWRAQNQQEDPESTTDAGRGLDVGYWIGESQDDRLRDRTIHCFGT